MAPSETTDSDEQADAPTGSTGRDTSWSANLERERHADSVERVVNEACDAVRATSAGVHVNLVTHSAHGHPREYLFGALESMECDLAVEYVDQCGCGGHVTRVHVE